MATYTVDAPNADVAVDLAREVFGRRAGTTTWRLRPGVYVVTVTGTSCAGCGFAAGTAPHEPGDDVCRTLAAERDAKREADRW